MATRAFIGIVNEDKSIEMVYSHWDGYPSYLGKILFNFYNDEKAVRDILKLGNVSVLREDIGLAHDETDVKESDEAALKNWSVFYIRDYGRLIEDESSVQFKHVDEAVIHAANENAWYIYLYNVKDERWIYLDLAKNPNYPWIFNDLSDCPDLYPKREHTQIS